MSEIDLGIEGLRDYREIGSGGFATAYAAYDEGFGRDVAIKVLHSVNADVRRRFDRERLLMGRLDDHPNVVTPYRFGYTAQGVPFLMMELLRGGSLQDVLERGPIRPEEAIGYVVPIAHALRRVHTEGILHRDIKPANILLTADEEPIPKLTDFGIAAIREATATQQAYTMAHSPPETFADVDRRDHRSDMYSLASTLYALITGRGPFDATDPGAPLEGHIARILTQPVASLGHEGLDAFFATAMAKKPDDRYSTATDWIVGLENVRSPDAPPLTASPWPPVAATSSPFLPEGSKATVIDRGSQPLTTANPQITSNSFRDGPAAQGRRFPRWPLAVVLMALLALGGLVAYVNTRDDSAQETADPPGDALPTSSADSPGEEPDGNPDEVTPEDSGAPEVIEFAGHDTGSATSSSRITSIIELADGRIASVGLGSDVLIWDPSNPTELEATLATRGASLIQLADGRVASGTGQCGVEFWDLEDPTGPSAAVEPGHSVTGEFDGDTVSSMIELADGRIASTCSDDTVIIWDPDDPESAMVARSGFGPIIRLADGRVVTGREDGVLEIWDLEDPNNSLIANFETAFSGLADGRIVTRGRDGVVEIWTPGDADRSDSYIGHAGGVNTAIQLADGRIASASDDGTVHLWWPSGLDVVDATADIYTGHVGFNGSVSSLVQLSDGRIASGDGEGIVQIWDPNDIPDE